MNDNNGRPAKDDELPEWVWKIADKYDLSVRADRPLGGVSVLLHDAAFDVREIAATVFREQELTSSTKQRLCKAIDMLNDAERLSAACDD